MNDRQKAILTLEQDASLLIDQLGALKREVSSYGAATNELDKIRAALEGFVEQTQQLTQQSHKLISTINEIGSAKIFGQLEAIQTSLAESAKMAVKRNQALLIGLSVVILLQVVVLIMLNIAR